MELHPGGICLRNLFAGEQLEFLQLKIARIRALKKYLENVQLFQSIRFISNETWGMR